MNKVTLRGLQDSMLVVRDHMRQDREKMGELCDSLEKAHPGWVFCMGENCAAPFEPKSIADRQVPWCPKCYRWEVVKD